jgi:amino acid transporter
MEETRLKALSNFFSWLAEWIRDFKWVAIVALATIGYFLWMLTMLAMFFMNPLFNVLWIPLPLVVAALVRYRTERTKRKKSDLEKAEQELAKTKRV